MKKRALITVIIFSILVFLFNRTTAVNPLDIPGFSPLRDDAIARKYMPVLFNNDEYGIPTDLLYRSSRDDSGRIHITYHYVWTEEINRTAGFLPFLNRIFYTGGLRLQRIMFGKGDVENVSIVIGQSGQVEKLQFERAANYSPDDFGVQHEEVNIDGPISLPIVLRVVSWNHLFDLEKRGPAGLPEHGSSQGSPVKLEVRYFTRELWEEYTMVKEHEKLLRKSRAHQPYERESVE